MKSYLQKYGVILFLLLILFGWSWYSYAQEGVVYSLVTSDVDHIVSLLEGFGVLGGVIFFALVILEVVIAPFPPLILYVVGGVLFGTVIGGTISLVGNVVGSVIAFMIARKLGRQFVEKRIEVHERKRFDQLSDKYGGLTIFLLRINPLTSSDVFSYLAGLSHMKLRSLVLGTLFGLAPLVYLQTYIGSDLIKGNPFLSLVFIWVGVAYLALFLWGLWWVVRKRKK